ncbi:hypothetical protein, partial [Chryseobacterium sp. SIMBA_028]|uniref:hypothetical protein n=1 Tax=Chryseobacterium sp. SIMBA_028 TaxID=3085771 RepID=UPI00397E1A9E
HDRLFAVVSVSLHGLVKKLRPSQKRDSVADLKCRSNRAFEATCFITKRYGRQIMNIFQKAAFAAATFIAAVSFAGASSAAGEAPVKARN